MQFNGVCVRRRPKAVFQAAPSLVRNAAGTVVGEGQLSKVRGRPSNKTVYCSLCFSYLTQGSLSGAFFASYEPRNKCSK